MLVKYVMLVDIQIIVQKKEGRRKKMHVSNVQLVHINNITTFRCVHFALWVSMEILVIIQI